ncbi:GNAT family N-acetyltransferase [Kitasatospora purpeofusca]|uniref:GNAT family N-acetyltransferase n=1 Tax=Kitasatospora purpeofusca TaxID=67352 RepID=UPI0036D304B3
MTPALKVGTCPCGSSRSGAGDDSVHREHHSEWAFGIPVPKNTAWSNRLVVVTSQSPIAWRRLTERVGRLPRREGGYDFNSWSHGGGEPEETLEHFRAYLLEADGHVVGYLAAHDSDRHRWWDLGERSRYGELVDSVRPRIDMIWVAETYRGHGIGRTLVNALADDSGCEVADVSWSTPVTDRGRQLALSLSPDGVWVS